MNSYILLNGKKYKTSAKNWFPVPSVPATVRLLLDGTVDVAYGPGTITEWQGTIEVPAQPEAGFGGLADFKTAFTARASLPFADHYGTAYTVHLLAPGGFRQRSLTPMWDAASNKFFVEVRIVRSGG